MGHSEDDAVHKIPHDSSGLYRGLYKMGDVSNSLRHILFDALWSSEWGVCGGS